MANAYRSQSRPIAEQVVQKVTDLGKLIDTLNNDPDQIIPGELVSHALVGGLPPARNAPTEAEVAALNAEREEILEGMRRAAEKIRREGPQAQLVDDIERLGGEAIVLLSARPPIRIRAGHFDNPPPEWQDLETYRPRIEQSLQSVGRVNVVGDPDPRYSWLGTGFVVSDGVFMTNRHVAEDHFCRQLGPDRWEFIPGASASVNFSEEEGSPATADFDLTEIVGIFDEPGPDLALFRIASRSRDGLKLLPSPLQLTSTGQNIAQGRVVYVVGYPAFDPRNSPSQQRRLFDAIFNVKRLQPGTIMDIDDQDSILYHDCSTLGGNSGSCVVDLETNRVIGLHFEGEYLKYNAAVSLWKHLNDPLVLGAGLNFVQ